MRLALREIKRDKVNAGLLTVLARRTVKPMCADAFAIARVARGCAIQAVDCTRNATVAFCACVGWYERKDAKT